MEQYDCEDNSVENIVFRILAPVFISYLLLSAVVALYYVLTFWDIAPEDWIPPIRWMPVVMYWVLYIVSATAKDGASYPIWTLLTQALTSLATTIYFDWAVVCRIPEEGIFAFDQSNIGWQVLMISFFAAGFLILFGIRRGLAKYNRKISLSRHYSTASSSSLDQATEKKIFSYIRKFDRLLPENFDQDPLLRSLFYTIMLIEDSNRPKWFRTLEHHLFWTKKVRSTGIMQVRSQKNLSDEESVELAIPIVQDLWNSFIQQTAKSEGGRYYPAVSFSQTWYKYDFDRMRGLATHSVNRIYGHYCGTFTLNAGKTFSAVSGFFQTTDPDRCSSPVYVESCLFKPAAVWMPNKELCFDQGAISLLEGDIPAGKIAIKIANNDNPDEALAKDCLNRLPNTATVLSVEYVPNIRCVISVSCETENNDDLSVTFPGWGITTANPNY